MPSSTELEGGPVCAVFVVEPKMHARLIAHLDLRIEVGEQRGGAPDDPSSAS
jgi:hypothetical protein